MKYKLQVLLLFMLYYRSFSDGEFCRRDPMESEKSSIAPTLPWTTPDPTVTTTIPSTTENEETNPSTHIAPESLFTLISETTTTTTRMPKAQTTTIGSSAPSTTNATENTTSDPHTTSNPLIVASEKSSTSAEETSTTHATTGSVKSSSTVAVDTTSSTTPERKTSRVPTTVTSKTSSSEATVTTRLTDMTTSTKGKGDTSTDNILATTSTTFIVTEAKTNITEDANREKGATLSSGTTKKEVTTQKTSTTTKDLESRTTTTAELPSSEKPAESKGQLNNTSQAFSTVSQDTMATEPTTESLGKSEKPSTIDVATTTTSIKKEVTTTVPTNDMKDDTTTPRGVTAQKTTQLDSSTTNTQTSVSSSKFMTTGGIVERRSETTAKTTVSDGGSTHSTVFEEDLNARTSTTPSSFTETTTATKTTNAYKSNYTTAGDVTTGQDKSSPTFTVDTSPRTTSLQKESSSVTNSVVPTTSSTEATGTTTVTDMTSATKGKSDTSTDATSNTRSTLRVTDAQTKITESISTERGETLSSNTMGEMSSPPVTIMEHLTTTEEKKLTTTTTEIPTSDKQTETTGMKSTSTRASSTVTKDTTTTEPTTKDLETTEKATTTVDFATTTTSSGKTATPTTPSDETEDELSSTMHQTTNHDLSSPEEQETLASTKGWTMGESEQPESGTTGKPSDRDIGTTSRQTTNDLHSESSLSHTTEAQKQTDHSALGTSNTNAKGTTGVTQQEPKTEKNTVTTQPEGKQTMESSEKAVDSSGKSGETTTATGGPLVEHFTDINVGEDESSTTVPDYCSSPCPDNFTEGANYCYMIPPKEKSTTYTMAISYCQMVSGPRSDLATSYDYQDNDNLELFQNMLNESERSTDHFFLNMLASGNFRKNLQADIVSLKQLTRYLQPVLKSIGSSEVIADVNSICRTTKFCKPNTCSFKQFTDLDKEQVVGLPSRKELTAGESIVVRCIQYNTSQVHTIACAETGSFKVHPSMVKCIAPADFQEDDPATPLDPLNPESCELCSDVGTESCSKNTTGTGVICHCKVGWTKRTCWKSPNLCTNTTCGEHGQCVSLVDRTECVCEYGMIGERCTVNATTISWMGINETIPIVSIRSIGLIAQTTSSLLLIGAKFLSKLLIIGECEDPQDTYQDYRHALLTIGNLAAVFFTHPDMFGVDAIGCRFFFWMITVCHSLGLLFWVNESINVYTTVRAVHRNTWNKNFAGEDKKYLRFGHRVIVPFLITVLAILLLCANSWNSVGSSWSCFGSFSTDATSTWYPLCAGNAALALLAFSFAEATSLLIKNRPHTLVRLHNWFNLNQPANFEIVGKVERNRYFTAIGPILQFLAWATLTVASDKNTAFLDSMSFLFGMALAGFNFVQMVVTSPAYYAWVCIGAMMVLPEKWSPTFEWTNLRNREEVLARYYKRRYKKEQDRKILDEDERKANEQREVDEKNAKLLQKYPNLPSTLLFHCPEEPPVITLPRPFPFDPSGKEYMTSFQREHLARIWTRSYLETRKFHKKSPEKSAFEVVKKEIQRNIFQVKTEDRKKQELFALAQWWNSVPAMDRTKLREHKNTVIMEDENEDDLLAFEREVSRLASIIDLRENRKRKGLLKDKETDPFKKTADFLKFEPAEAIKCVLFETVDGLGDVKPRKFLKKPPIVLKRQIDEYDKAYSHGVAELNKPFDKTYDDDLMVTQWSDTEHSQAVKEIMNVSPSQIGEQPISMNPRKRPLDEFWFDHERPDFVGPREKHEIPIGPYEEYARKCHYYQSLTDAQWSQIEHNSYHMANLRKIRRGEL